MLNKSKITYFPPNIVTSILYNVGVADDEYEVCLSSLKQLQFIIFIIDIGEQSTKSIKPC